MKRRPSWHSWSNDLGQMHIKLMLYLCIFASFLVSCVIFLIQSIISSLYVQGVYFSLIFHIFLPINNDKLSRLISNRLCIHSKANSQYKTVLKMCKWIIEVILRSASLRRVLLMTLASWHTSVVPALSRETSIETWLKRLPTQEKLGDKSSMFDSGAANSFYTIRYF